MIVDFSQIDHEDFEFLTEDILIKLGFTIDSRPGRGPDQGKDILAIRHVTDDLGITESQRLLVECKHFFASNKSVQEADLGNFEIKMKQHAANRYLLVTTTTASETVKNQLRAVNNDEHGGRKATFWGQRDLVSMLMKYESLFQKYFQSWEKEAAEATNYVREHFSQAHRGAMLWSPGITAIFGNDGYYTEITKSEVTQLRQELLVRKIQEVVFHADEEEYSWVLLVRSDDAREMGDMIWRCAKDRFKGREFAYELEQKEAHKVLWTYFDRAHKAVINREA